MSKILLVSVGLFLLEMVFLMFLVWANDFSYLSLKDGYQNLWDKAIVSNIVIPDIDRVIDEKILPNQSRYEQIQERLGIPWYVVAVLHYRESDCNFTKHLHNGDPLTARTVHIPKGRPPTGHPPFTWFESAEDALILEGLDRVDDWSVPSILYQLEKFNGFGYFNKKVDINSPYLWSGTNFYKLGKFDTDNHYNSRLRDRQLGCVVLLKRMIQRGIIEIYGIPQEEPTDNERTWRT